MAIQRLSSADFVQLTNPGVSSEQIVWPQNAPGAHVTITRVTMQPGAISPRHAHEAAEQTWLIECGEATLLMDQDRSQSLRAGDVVRTPPGDVHGIENTGDGPFVYLAITSPPQDFTAAYQRREDDR
jgi:quercetin dioxygenase-like cupin family protein